jgi:predicted DNA binding CopG/RHH family protein
VVSEFVLSELDFGELEGGYMRRKERVKDTNEPKGKLVPVSDFLPAPEELLPSEETIKITIALDSETLKFFKKYADKAGLKYQRIIREVLKGYARKYG